VLIIVPIVLIAAAAYASAVLATLSKEIGFTVLGVFVTIEVLEQMKLLAADFKRRGRIKINDGDPSPHTLHTDQCGLEVFLRAMGACLTQGPSMLRVTVLLVAAIAYFHLRRVLHGPETLLYRWSIMENHVLLMPSLMQRSLAYAQYHFWYFWKLLFPAHLCFDYGYKCVRDVERIADPMNLLPLTLYISLFYNVWRSISRIRVAQLMSLAMMVIPIMPALNIILPVGTLLAERLLFIPSMGFCMLAGQLLAVDCHDYFDWGSEYISLRLDVVLGCIWHSYSHSRSGSTMSTGQQQQQQVPPRLEQQSNPQPKQLLSLSQSQPLDNSCSGHSSPVDSGSTEKKRVRFDLKKKAPKHSAAYYRIKQTGSIEHPPPMQQSVPESRFGGGIHSMGSTHQSEARVSVSVLPILMAVLLVCCGWKIVVRNRDWQDELSLYRSGLDVCPTSLKVLTNYALLSIAHGQTRIGRSCPMAAMDYLSVYV